MCEFEVFVSKEDFKFNCAHFIAYKGFRERLHGHNYRVSVRVTGSDFINEDGYVLDFGDIKKVARKLCKSLNEYFICPTKSTDMVITEADGQVCLECEDGSKFSFPRSDCAMLPIVHSSAEELAHWFWCCMIRYTRHPANHAHRLCLYLPIPNTHTAVSHSHTQGSWAGEARQAWPEEPRSERF